MSKNNAVSAKAGNPFLTQLNGTFHGLLRWPELASFWEVLKQMGDSGWYIYTVGDQPPERPASQIELLRFIEETDALIKRLHEEDYCGVVYVDDRDSPSFVQVFHPKNMGYGTCSLATTAPLPRWILSTVPPADLTADQRKADSRSLWGEMMACIGNAFSAKAI